MGKFTYWFWLLWGVLSVTAPSKRVAGFAEHAGASAALMIWGLVIYLIIWVGKKFFDKF